MIKFCKNKKLLSLVCILFSLSITAKENKLIFLKARNNLKFNKTYQVQQDFIPIELATLKEHVIHNILSQNIDLETIKKLARNLKSNGTWSDIDYKDKTRGGWPVNIHLVRLLDMAIVYTLKKDPDINYTNLENKIITGIEFWLVNDLQSPNWWYPKIGTPKILGPLMLLMEQKLSAKQMQKGIEILNRSKIGMTGQNKVWLSGNVIYRSLLTHDVAQVYFAAASIQEEIIISESEGIQPDLSFHQHGPQQQFGNYGTHYAEDISKWAVIFQNTPFQFKPEKIEILRSYLLNGIRWVIYNNQMDISACGRELFPNQQLIKARRIKEVFNKMPVADPAFTDQYLIASDRFEGNIYFWRSDMNVHRRKNFYTSLKMSSNRVVGSESCNSENTQGYHLGDGANYFYQSGKEYLNIFPFWNWKQIPGTTAYNDAGMLPLIPCMNGYCIASDFVGGVSDSLNGVTTLAYNRDSIKAQKSWFFIDDAIVCLGAGISAGEDKTVNTTINQSFLKGQIILNDGARTHNAGIGRHSYSNLKWLIHDNWGYVFPESQYVELTNKKQTGNWHNFVKRLSSENITADIFTLWIAHGLKPINKKYAYYVFPNASTANINARSSEIKILENSKKLQAIEIKKKQTAGFVFVKAGESSSKIFKKVSVNKACILMLTKANNNVNISVSDPTHFLIDIKIGLSGKKSSVDCESEYYKDKKMSFFTVKLPQGAEAGKSVCFRIENK